LGGDVPCMLWRVGSVLGLCIMLSRWTAGSVRGQVLDTADVQVTLDSALHLAQKAAASAFPDLSDYLLYSVTPRVLKGDSRGLHWQVRWQERAFPQPRWLVVRVYTKDGHTATERLAGDTAPSPPSAPAH
jgi:hypothetical protein